MRYLKLREEEAKELRASLEQQQQRDEQLQIKALETVHNAIEEERKKWEAEKVKALQVHCGILEERNRKSLEGIRSETQREKSKVVELKTRVQDMESERCAQQRAQESLLAVLCKSLKEEHRAELQTSQRQMAQERQRAVLRLEQAAQVAEKEADELHMALEESQRSHKQTTAELEQQLGHWAQELGAECHHLQLLEQQTGATPSDARPAHSPTAAEALTHLRTLREQLKHSVNRLQQELDSQKETTEQLRKDKERELSIQRRQLRMDRDHALDSLKERLILEHVEELSRLKRPPACDGGALAGGAAASLRTQLKAKDLDLRQVQSSMAQFEEELTAELERNPSKPLEDEGEMRLGAEEAPRCVRSPSLHVVDSAAPRCPPDVSSLKLLRYLQSRVKQLRVENQENNWSPSPLKAIASDRSGSYLTTGSALFE
ncbi:trichohyalin-like [Pseudoliparis swirei]|uniref:trichohyalin-like n=1 Tax=Pseudoliparis swirei TaxID=2059687 RepID=UPI0024BEC2C7|nr:trichohyalin-like [Pseudoliparis swirei]